MFWEILFSINLNLIWTALFLSRPETEELVDLIIKYECKKENILDIGSGSGCIAVTLASILKNLM